MSPLAKNRYGRTWTLASRSHSAGMSPVLMYAVPSEVMVTCLFVSSRALRYIDSSFGSLTV